MTIDIAPITSATDTSAADTADTPGTEKNQAQKRPKNIGIPKEVFPGEDRVAATPDTAKTLQKLGFDVWIESGAGAMAHFSDDAYRQVGCHIVDDPVALWETADVILKVRPPDVHPTLDRHEATLLSEGGTLISFIYPAQNSDLLQQLAARKATVLGMDTIPRISRAQKMDALSSMANLAGYRAVIEATSHFSRFFSGQITAAGKVPPAKVMIIGAGVAGLSAIATARSLGAIVRAFDTRPVVKEQVQSLGAEFLELQFAEDGTGEGGYAKVMSDEFIKAEMALFAAQAKEVDVIITTALIPGKTAPVLITQEMVESMKDGSIVVDMAAEQGGNCAVTRPGEVYRYGSITIVGLTDLPSRMAHQASQLYGTNLCHFLEELGGSHHYSVDLANEVVRGALILHEGTITYPPPRPAAHPEPKKPDSPAIAGPPKPSSTAAPLQEASPSPKPPSSPQTPASSTSSSTPWLILIGCILVGIGLSAPESFLSHFTVFVLACFVGWQVIWNVKPALHTPLMSVTNAISGIIIIGGMLQLAEPSISATAILGAIAILIGTINIAGGFLVTQRMLNMFQK